MKVSGLYDAMDTMHIGMSGEMSNWHVVDKITSDNSKLKVEYASHANTYEYGALTLMHKHAANNNDILFYLHTKSVTRPDYVPYIQSRDNLNTHNITRWRDRLQDITQGKSHSGYNFTDHYAGNYYWTNSSFVNLAGPPVSTTDRFYYEKYLFTNTNPHH
jgi:hypothetical protein